MFLIIAGILVAVGYDVNDELLHKYRNGDVLEATLVFNQSPLGTTNKTDARLLLNAGLFRSFYPGSNIPVSQEIIDQPVIVQRNTGGDFSIALSPHDNTPDRWIEMAKNASVKNQLTAKVMAIAFIPNTLQANTAFQFEPIHYVKIKAITQAAIDYSQTAVEISIGLIGIMVLWLGMMKVAEAGGMIQLMTKLVRPVTQRLFPEIPHDHPAIGAIIMNTAANMLGLNNAATPLGLKAMEELNKLNPKPGTATNAMCTFLVINTGGMVIIPATVIAIRAATGSSNPGIIIATSIVGSGVATIMGLIFVKIFQRLPVFNKDDDKVSTKEKAENDKKESE
jgi:spore maturation protein A